MGINRTTPTDYAVDVNYWKIVGTNILWQEKRCEIVLAGFTTKEARDTNKKPLVHSKIMISGESFDLTDSIESGVSLRGQIYTKIKAMPEFSGATDVE